MKERLIFLFKVALIVLLFGFIGCPFRKLFGISCLGCGMSRAWISALQFNFVKAFIYHPLWILPAVYVLSYLFLYDTKAYNIICTVMVIMFFVVYFIRLAEHDPVVAFNIKEGLVPKLLDCIF